MWYNGSMGEFLQKITVAYKYFRDSGWMGFCIYLFLAFIAVTLVHRLFRTLLHHDRLPRQVLKLLDKALVTLIWCFALVQGLRAIGVDVVSILGAAGVVGIAIGFASQTSLSNLISGIFIISERNIRLGDYIKIAGEEGTVESINLLSINLRQVDNSLVRIPCETVIKSPVINVTGAPLRRCDLDIGVDYASDLEQVRRVILEVIAADPELQGSRAPVIRFSNFSDSAVLLHIGAWCKTSVYHDVRFRLADRILKTFREKGINIPFPTVSVRNDTSDSEKTPSSD